MMVTDFCGGAPDLAQKRTAGALLHGQVRRNFHHYELLAEHFTQVKGYGAHAQNAEIARKGGLADATEGFMKAAPCGGRRRASCARPSTRATAASFSQADDRAGRRCASCLAVVAIYSASGSPDIHSWSVTERGLPPWSLRRGYHHIIELAATSHPPPPGLP
jgi:hypothetical protein